MVIGKTPFWVGVPESTPVVALKVTPVGRAPDSLKVGAGVPVAVTVKVPAVPWVKVALLPEVMVGAAFTVRVKLWVAFGETPLVAVMVIGKLPLWVGVPESTPAAVNVTPVGRGPVSLKVGAGLPVAVTVKLPAVPWVKVALLPEVMVGGAFTVRVKLWVAFGETPLVAVMVIGKTPPWVGVPESTPVVALSVTPAGRAPVSLKVGGP